MGGPGSTVQKVAARQRMKNGQVPSHCGPGPPNTFACSDDAQLTCRIFDEDASEQGGVWPLKKLG